MGGKQRHECGWHSGNQDFDSSQYKSFKADDDGIIPLLEADWGIRDDAANRLLQRPYRRPWVHPTADKV